MFVPNLKLVGAIGQCPVESKRVGSDLSWRMAIVSHLYLFSRMQYYSLFATPTRSSSSQSSLICTGRRSLPLFGVVAAELTCLTGSEETPQEWEQLALKLISCVFFLLCMSVLIMLSFYKYLFGICVVL